MNVEDNLVDLTTVKGVDPRTTLVLLNHFVSTTSSFLNHFYSITDSKLERLSRNIGRLEIKLSILEAKLGSIQGIEGVSAAAVDTAPLPSVPETEAPAPAGASAPAAAPAAAAPAAPAPGVMLNKDDPAYLRYFKLIKLGLHIDKVKMKAASEGCTDTSFLDNPDAPSSSAAPGGAAPAPPDVAAAPATGPPLALPDQPGAGHADAAAPVVEPAEPAEPVMKIKDDPKFKKYFKMLKFRVPAAQIKGRMAADGVDPAILDMNPEAPSPSTGGSSGADVLAIEDQ